MDLLAGLGDSAKVVATVFGIVTAIGTIYQVGWIKKDDDARIKDALGRWFAWVKSWPYKYFAQAEANRFLEILDRYAGDKFWTRKRWAFAGKVFLFCLLLALAWTFASVAAWMHRGRLHFDWWHVYHYTFSALFVLLLIPIFAISISVTRLITSFVSRGANTGATAALAFFALLGIHVILFVYWSTIVFAIAFVAAIFITELWSMLRGEVEFPSIAYIWRSVTSIWMDHLGEVRFILDGFGTTQSPAYAATHIVLILKFFLDIFANGIRIIFALVFVGSYVVPIAVQIPLVNAWERAAGSDKPLFGLMLGSAAGVVAFLFEAVSWLYVTSRYLLSLT